MFLSRNAEQRAGASFFILSQSAARPALHGRDLPQPAKAFLPPLHQKGDFFPTNYLICTCTFTQLRVRHGWLIPRSRIVTLALIRGMSWLLMVQGMRAVGSMDLGRGPQEGIAPFPGHVCMCHFFHGTSCTHCTLSTGQMGNTGPQR